MNHFCQVGVKDLDSSNDTVTEIELTDRFLKSFDACADKPMVFREIAELLLELDRKSGKEKGTARNIKSLTGPIRDQGQKHGLALQEWKLTQRARLIFDYSTHLRIIDFANDDTHTVVEKLNKLSPSTLNKIFSSFTPASARFLELVNRHLVGRSIEGEIEGSDRHVFTEEHFDEWTRFLDRPQIKVRDAVLSSVLSSKEPQLHFILGGPGTGKTMVLIDLAVQFELLTGEVASLQLPTSVREYVEKTSPEVLGTRVEESKLVLIDDPSTFDVMTQRINRAQHLDSHVVVAIDPTQWHERKTIEQFHKYLERTSLTRHELQLCYRQGGLVGGKAIEMVKYFLEHSSAFAAEEKVQLERDQASEWENLCLRDIKFSDQGGHFSLYDDPDLASAALELELLKAMEFETYRSWPKVLIGSVDKDELPAKIKKVLKSVLGKYPQLTTRFRSFKQVTEVRGTEYETVILLVTSLQLARLKTGIIGAGTADWTSLSPLLAFLTRAENRLAIIVVSY